MRTESSGMQGCSGVVHSVRSRPKVYESLANYCYLEVRGQLAYIKPNNHESSKTRKYKQQIGRTENMSYDEPGDYFLCHEGRMLVRIGDAKETGRDGTERMIAHYRCEDCSNCPSRAACCKARDLRMQKQLVVCWEKEQLRKASAERIATEEGKLLRVNRSIQAEGSFGQLKHNRGFKRFLTAGFVKQADCQVQQEVLANTFFESEITAQILIS